ncbi:ElyC/SanA/YdcF family protein [Roseisolibacter sp. H3M3-2]|uniref:YdcF family protein n=1 Tax=Roseisolibacter sp. H3M3-2 TaxID=3031323 RepID=UPI0023DCE67B|nr:ElyC/SanA/YdcF family protein [Roseisolibacter sp. H3M3-2]MDF1503929.1 ElyC/SanA/YdcF family protein [Roseisolibacter sp. H3M3-2]
MFSSSRSSGYGPRAGYRGPAGTVHDSPTRRALRGAVLAVLLWSTLGRLGVQDAVGIPELAGLPFVALAGALLGWRSWLAAVWIAGAIATVGLIAVTATPLVRPLVAGRLASDAAPDAMGADAVFVLSGAVTDAGLVSGQAPERLLHGLRLARQADLPLVMSVVRNRGREGAESSADDQRALAAMAGLDARLSLLDSVTNTRDEAVRVAALARANGWRRLAVVTSPLHARRACAAVARAGVAVRCAPAPSRELSLTGPRPLTGAEERLRAFGLWAYETAGWMYYKARGWV